MRAILLVVAAILGSSGAWADDSLGCEKQAVVPIFGDAIDASGTSKLCIGPGGVDADLKVAGLIPGDIVTVWWAYIDDPSQCLTPGMCADPDFFGVKPIALFGRMGSGMVSKQGRVRVSGDWGAMRPSAGSQIWTLMFTHGEAGCAGREIGEADGQCRSEGDALARQTLTPEDAAFPPQLGNAVDGNRFFGAAIAVFQITDGFGADDGDDDDG